MKDTKAKSTNALMKHLRTDKGLKISGSKGKNDLQNLGYYHGYKGYRFYKTKGNLLPYSDFKELKAVYDYDMRLKSLFYPMIMFIETALKNRVLEAIVDVTNSSDFSKAYHEALTGYADNASGSRAFKDGLKLRVNLRSQIYDDIAKNIENPIVQHYYGGNRMVPLWGIFEFLTLGEFGTVYICLNRNLKINICKKLKFNMSMNTDGGLLGSMIFIIKDLRNAIAHNSPTFDVRFASRGISKTLCNYIEHELGLPKPNPYYGRTTMVNFTEIIDYFLLLIYLLRQLGVSKTELKRYIRDYESIFADLTKSVGTNIYSVLVPTNFNHKIFFLKKNI